jgi:hypothetical protein
MLCDLPSDACALVLLLCDAWTLAAVRAVSLRLLNLADEAMLAPMWACRHSTSLGELLWLARPPPALKAALRCVWASCGVPADLSGALPYACSHVPSSRRGKILARLGVGGKAHALHGAQSGGLRPGAGGSLRQVLMADSSSDSDSDSDCAGGRAFHEIQLHERASRRPQPSPADPSTHIVLRLSPGPVGGWAGHGSEGGWAIIKETRYRDTRLQKALCGFEPQTTRHAQPRQASWHSRSCKRHPIRCGAVRPAEWRADPDGAATRAWRDELDYDCCCHIDWP